MPARSYIRTTGEPVNPNPHFECRRGKTDLSDPIGVASERPERGLHTIGTYNGISDKCIAEIGKKKKQTKQKLYLAETTIRLSRSRRLIRFLIALILMY